MRFSRLIPVRMRGVDDWAEIDALIRAGQIMGAIMEARTTRVNTIPEAHRLVMDRREQLREAASSSDEMDPDRGQPDQHP